MSYKHKRKTVNQMMSREDLEMATAHHFNDLLSHYSYFASTDDMDYFEPTAMFVMKMLCMAVALRSKDEEQFLLHFDTFAETMASPEVRAEAIEMARLANPKMERQAHD